MPQRSPSPSRDAAEGDEPSAAEATAGGWMRRVVGLLDRKPTSPRSRRILVLVAMVVFLAVSIPSLGALRDGPALRPAVLPLLVLVTTPLMVLANAAEYRVMGAINGHRIAWRDASQLTILAAVANLLPLPGGVVVRTQALRNKGSSYKKALGANLAAGLAWIACGALAVGALLLADVDRRLVAGGVLAGGVALVVGVGVLLHRADPEHARSHLLRLLAIEAGIVVVSATRLWLGFALLGISAEPAQAVMISGSVIIAAAIGIFPAGLGLREALAGGIAVIVDMPARLAVLATAADRVAAQLGLAIVAGLLALLTRGAPPVEEDDLDDPTLQPLDLP